MRRLKPKYLLPLLILVIVFYLFKINSDLNFKYSERDKDEERNRIMAYSIQCYATEGIYPPSLEYLEKRYGLRLKKNIYAYFYDSFASNLRPDIKILEKIKNNSPDIINGERPK